MTVFANPRDKFVETEKIEPDEMETLTPDNCIGLVTLGHGESFDERMLVDMNRLQRGILAYREKFGDEKVANIGIVDTGKTEAVALYPDDNKQQAILISPRLRSEGGGSDDV